MTRAKYAAQDRYRERQMDKRGFIRLCIWVPPDAKEKLVALADKLRRIARQKGDDNG